MSFVCARCTRALARRQSSSSRNIYASQPSLGRKDYAATQQRRGFRLAVIGSGPAGFYASGKVMREIKDAKIDMYEKIPIPFGLVRYGVAPDHPEVKNCQTRFAEIAESSNFTFVGNVEVGKDVSLETLREHYDAIMFSYGASKDRTLGIPGEDLDGVYSARDFVAWYNGLPGATDIKPRISEGTDAIVIGQGNVALDIARILLTDVDVLRKTDVPEYALDALSKSKINSVRVIGRRGPLQAAFTIKEVREIAQIPSLLFKPISRELFPSDLKGLPRPRKRIAELLLKSGQEAFHTAALSDKKFAFDFLLNPCGFRSSSTDSRSLSLVRFEENVYSDLTRLANPFAAVSRKDGVEEVDFPAVAAFRSIGYKAEPIAGMNELDMSFDVKKGVIPNEGGRIFTAAENSAEHDAQQGSAFALGLYVAGWVKRGPTGVIASTMEEAFQTADAIVQDHQAGAAMLPSTSKVEKDGWEGIKRAIVTDARPTRWEDWQRLDQVERERGQALGKEREKIVRIEDMMKVLDR